MRIQAFAIHLPRNPLLRVLVLACGAVVAAGLVALGLFVGLAVMTAAIIVLAVRRWLHHRRTPADPGIIEGEFTVVSRSRSALPRAD